MLKNAIRLNIMPVTTEIMPQFIYNNHTNIEHFIIYYIYYYYSS